MANICWTSINFRSVADCGKIERFAIKDGHFDFNAFIPQPKSPDGLDEKYILNEGSGVVQEDGRKWFNWYKWNCDHWATKCNADNTDLMGQSICFVTAWGAPYPVFRKMAELFPEVSFEAECEIEGEDLVEVYANRDGKWYEGTYQREHDEDDEELDGEIENNNDGGREV